MVWRDSAGVVVMWCCAVILCFDVMFCCGMIFCCVVVPCCVVYSRGPFVYFCVMFGGIG